MRLGLPHCHLVIQLHNTPDITEQRVLVSFINKHITAECPDPTTIYSEPEFAQQQAEYCNLLSTCMVHKCYPSTKGGCLDDMGKCKRNYTFVSETYLDERGFPVYRSSQKGLRVVPHNRLMVLDWDGHVIVEYSASTYTVSLILLVLRTIY